MVGGGTGKEFEAFSKRRAQFAGPPGIKGLIQNSNVFAIAVFASLGGLVYGCEYRIQDISKQDQ